MEIDRHALYGGGQSCGSLNWLIKQWFDDVTKILQIETGGLCIANHALTIDHIICRHCVADDAVIAFQVKRERIG